MHQIQLVIAVFFRKHDGNGIAISYSMQINSGVAKSVVLEEMNFEIFSKYKIQQFSCLLHEVETFRVF